MSARIKQIAIILSPLLLAACGGGGGGGNGGGTATYTVGGNVTGLTGQHLTLQLNGGDALPINADGAFTFAALPDGTAYSVTIGTQPDTPAQECVVTDGDGTIAGANVTDVTVTCDAAWDGTKLLGVSGGEVHGTAVALGAGGNVYVAGDTDKALGGESHDFGGVNGTAAVITRYDRLGAPSRTWLLGGAGFPIWANDIAVDSAEGFYVTGQVRGSLLPEVEVVSPELYLVKYNSDGSPGYTKQWGVAGKFAWGQRVAIDEAGNALVLGGTAFGGVVQALVLLRYDADGELVAGWPKTLDGAYGIDMAVDSTGNIYLTGSTKAVLPSGTAPANSLQGVTDYFLAKYDAQGNLLYARQFGATDASYTGKALAIGANGTVHVAVESAGALQLISFDANGTPGANWQFELAVGDLTVEEIALDTGGNIVVVGKTTGKLTDDATWNVTQDGFMAKFSPAGTLLYAHQFGAADKRTNGNDVAIDGDQNAFLVGETEGDIDGLTHIGLWDAYVAKINAAGIKQ